MKMAGIVAAQSLPISSNSHIIRVLQAILHVMVEVFD
jgi:hypothetical protein